MDPLKLFQEYADAFEATYADDNWQRLEPFFAEDASYVTHGMPLQPINAQGRGPLIIALANSVNQFDRRCDSRKLELLAPPEVKSQSVTITWRGTYTLEGAEDLVLDGVEEIWFNQAGKIFSIVDRYSEEMGQTVLRWFQANQAAFP
ncbi:MAG: hypothetical protein AAGD06_26850 [Acidobacteriota bacterium]